MTGQFTESHGIRHRSVRMRARFLIFILTNFCALQFAYADSMPTWITKGPVSDATYHYVICSHDGIDPEDARQIAESKCLASAAKLGGVNVRITQKTIQSLTGSDSSEVAEIQPLEVKIKCEWTDRFLEKIKDGFRVWLRCRVEKKTVPNFEGSAPGDKSVKSEPLGPNKQLGYKRAVLSLASIPRADRIIILNDKGERAVIEVKSNVENIELKEGDLSIILKKQKFQNEKVELGKWENGDSISRTVQFKPEL